MTLFVHTPPAPASKDQQAITHGDPHRGRPARIWGGVWWRLRAGLKSMCAAERRLSDSLLGDVLGAIALFALGILSTFAAGILQ